MGCFVFFCIGCGVGDKGEEYLGSYSLKWGKVLRWGPHFWRVMFKWEGYMGNLYFLKWDSATDGAHSSDGSNFNSTMGMLAHLFSMYKDECGYKGLPLSKSLYFLKMDQIALIFVFFIPQNNSFLFFSPFLSLLRLWEPFPTNVAHFYLWF